jgi:hypothetical protein
MTIRTTVSLPVWLKAKMDLARVRHDVNWSAVFARAAEAELARLEAGAAPPPIQEFTDVMFVGAVDIARVAPEADDASIP